MNIPAADRAALEIIVADLACAWNSADAARFAEQFAFDGEQVNIFGAQLHGRREIEERHAKVFQSVFRESINTLRIVDASLVASDVLLARISSTVDVPHGTLKGELQTIASVVLHRRGARWEIILFHNTRVAP